MNSRLLIDRFESARAAAEPIVLVTVYETLGSTYSKAGARMLVFAGGDSHGLVSGGCLEGDLAERARQVLASGVPLGLTSFVTPEIVLSLGGLALLALLPAMWRGVRRQSPGGEHR